MLPRSRYVLCFWETISRQIRFIFSFEFDAWFSKFGRSHSCEGNEEIERREEVRLRKRNPLNTWALLFFYIFIWLTYGLIYFIVIFNFFNLDSSVTSMSCETRTKSNHPRRRHVSWNRHPNCLGILLVVVLRVEGCVVSGISAQGWTSNSATNWGTKNKLNSFYAWPRK